MKEKKQVVEEVKNLISSFSSKHLSEEEQRICLHIWERLVRKRTIEITRIRPENWAAATIWSFCRANFKYEEGLTLELVCSFFTNNKSTVGNRAGEISKMLKIDFFNPEFTTEALQKENPLNKLRVTEEGFIIPKDDSPDSETVNRYLRLQSAQRGLNHVLLNTLPPDAIKECGLRFGLFHDNTFFLGNEIE